MLETIADKISHLSVELCRIEGEIAALNNEPGISVSSTTKAFVDETHRHHAELFNRMMNLEHRFKLETFLADHKTEFVRSSFMEYRSGGMPKIKRAAIEKAISDTARLLGYQD